MIEPVKYTLEITKQKMPSDEWIEISREFTSLDECKRKFQELEEPSKRMLYVKSIWRSLVSGQVSGQCRLSVTTLSEK